MECETYASFNERLLVSHLTQGDESELSLFKSLTRSEPTFLAQTQLDQNCSLNSSVLEGLRLIAFKANIAGVGGRIKKHIGVVL